MDMEQRIINAEWARGVGGKKQTEWNKENGNTERKAQKEKGEDVEEAKEHERRNKE